MPYYPNRYMIDIHMHVIPGVDDGAREQGLMALRMVMRAADQGIRGIFATPHDYAFDNQPEKTRENYRLLTEDIPRWVPGVTLYTGCEVLCEPHRMETILEALNNKTYPTMNGTPYVLMEFSRWVLPEDTTPCVEALVKGGYIPIIAHMEKYENLRNNMTLVESFRAMGALLQMNICSLVEEQDEAVKAWAQQLVRQRKVDFVGTDAHNTQDRPPSAAWGISWLYDHADPEYVDAITHGNAEELLTSISLPSGQWIAGGQYVFDQKTHSPKEGYRHGKI